MNASSTQYQRLGMRIVLLVFIVWLGAYLRFTGLESWDEPSFRLHPDERFLTEVASQIRLPGSFTEYIDSSTTPLNPRNGNYKFFVYGMLPHEITRLSAVALTPPELLPATVDRNGVSVPNPEYAVAESFPREVRAVLNPESIDYTGRIHVVGRAWSAIFDVLSLLVVFLLARRLYDETIAYVAALMYAGTGFLIQQTHFFTVDATSAFFIVLTIYFAVRIHQEGRWSDYVWAGVAIGGAIACRITLATVAVAVIVAALARAFRAVLDLHPRLVRREFGLLVACGVIALLAARTLGPDMFTGSMDAQAAPVVLGDKIGSVGVLLDTVMQGKGFWDVRPDVRFLQSMSDISRFASGDIDWPPTQQWAARPRYLFALSNMVWAGMGAPLGIAAWLGFVVIGWQIWRRQHWQHLVPWAWVAFFFGWQGGQFLMTMRYYLPIYGVLILMAAWLVVTIARWRQPLYAKVMGWMWRPGDPQLHRAAAVRWGRAIAFMTVVPAVVVVSGALAWGYAFSRIYTEDHTRIAASRWIYANIPPGMTLSSEIWDDGLPLGLDGRSAGEYAGEALPVYAEDEYVKYYGDGSAENAGMLAQLDRVDYIILSSNRVYDTAGRLVMRYPALINYYKTLFDGSLGFELVAEFRSSPRLFGIEFPTAIWAEEAFSVYDHPRVLIFKKTARYSREQAEALLFKGVAFDEVYKLPTIRASKVMTALHLTDAQWPTYRNSAAWGQLFSTTTTTVVPWLWWLLACEIIALASFVLLQRWLQGLPDRGLALSKTFGLVLVAWLIWLAASVGVLSFNRAGLLVIVGPLVLIAGVVVWWQRAHWAQLWQQYRWMWLTTQGIFWLAFAAFVMIRAANPDLWHPARGGEKPMDVAFLTAVVRSPSFPPYDPWFAGGMLNYYYFGFVMVGVLVHLTGIAPSTAYNLAVPLLFALTAVGVWGVALALQGWQGQVAAVRWRDWWHRIRATNQRKVVGALLAALLVTVAGNWAQALWFMPGSARDGQTCEAGDSYAAVAGCFGRPEWAFWDATRVVSIKTGDGVINEFPFFTFLFADLHAHMIGLPLLVAALGVMTALMRQPKSAPHWRALWGQRTGLVVGLGLLSGVAYATNTWDYPTILGLALLTLLLLAWRDRQMNPQYSTEYGLPLAIGGVLASAALASWPFTRAFASDYTGFEAWTGMQTPTALLLEISGLWLYAALSAGAVLMVRLRWLTARSAGFAALAVAGVWGLAAVSEIPALYLEVVTIALVGALLVALLTRAWPVFDWHAQWSQWRTPAVQLELPTFADLERRPQARPVPVALETLFVLVLVLAVVGISALTEVLVAKGDIGRMNSVFKFGMQVWVFGGLTAGILLPWVWQRLWTFALNVQLLWRVLTIVAVSMAFVYPVTATPARIGERYDGEAGLSLNGESFLRSPNATWGENGVNFTFNEDADAIDWIRANVHGTPILLEAHAEAYRWSARMATYTGLPTILGWPWHETQQRSVADVGPVLAARQAAIQRWYSGGDPATVLREIQTYGIEYVYVGQMERALYGPQADAAFVALATQGSITEVFRSGLSVLYQVPVADHAPGVLKTATLPQLPATPPPPRESQGAQPPRNPTNAAGDALLTVANDRLATVARPGWSPWQDTGAAVVMWALAWYLIGACGLAVAIWWGDQHWPWARLIGLLLLGYLLWLPVSARLMFNDTTGLLVAFVAVALVNVWALLRIGMRQRADDGDASDARWFAGAQWAELVYAGLRHVGTTLVAQRQRVLVFEGIHWVAFAAMVLIRMANPDLWHPIWGGEKPFEFGMLNAVLQSPVMPPYSPFYSGGTLNYYYFGYVLYALPIRLSGLLPEIGYNLILASVFALVVLAVVTLSLQMSKRWWVALLAVFVVVVAGNPATVVPSGWSEGLAPVWRVLQSDGLAGLGAPLGDWFVGPSRVIPNTINEFPAWSFLFGDLHAHVLAMPVFLMVIMLAWHAIKSPRLNDGWVVLTVLSVGALAITNSWDVPTAVLVLAGAVYARQPAGIGAVGRALIVVALVAGVANVAYLPFFQQYVPQIAGVALVTTPSPWGAWLGMWGGFVVPTLAVLAWLLWSAPRQRLWLVVVVALLIVGVALTAERITLPDAPWLVWLSSPRLWLLSVVLVVAVALLIRPMSRPMWFALWLMCVGWAVALGVELIYIRDHMDGGDWYRMNTVFKFGMQTWVLLGIAFAVMIGQVWATVLRAPTWVRAVVIGVSAVPWLLGAIFPVVAIPNRTAYRINADQVWTINGLQFMQTGSYQAYDRTIAFVSDYEALQWLRANVTGVPVVLQSSNEFYRDYGVRIAANTGLPTVVSPLHESEQRDGSVVARRDADVVEFYRGTDSGRKLQILSRYRVAYVIVGLIERAVYGADGIAVVEQLPQLREVARFGETTIYQVAPNVIAIAPVGASDDIEVGDVVLVPPPDANENRLNADELQALEEAFRADTSNIDAMMLLADAYRQLGRGADAATTIDTTLQAHPDDVMLLHMYADASLEGGLVDQGIRALRTAVTVDPSPGNLNKLITGMIQVGLFEDALREISDARQVYPDFFDFLVSQGQVYELMGNLEQARQSYQEYLAQAPADALFREDVRRALANLER